MSTPRVAVDRHGLAKVRAALDQAGYTSPNVQKALRTSQPVGAQAGEVVVFERRLAGHTPLATLMRLFLIGSTVDRAQLQASLPNVPVGELERLGLVEPMADGIQSTMRIIPHGDIVIACDRNYYGDAQNHEADVVTGVNSPTTLLADLTVRRRVQKALDLGTGGGIQALLVANHSKEVVAVDINPHALYFAELNAALNRVDNIELRLGSWFEPVKGERFDIITANPPYVISPDSTFIYRDSGMPADSLCRQLVQDMPTYLQEGGFGHILISWALATDEDWSRPLRRWVHGLPCDVLLLHYLTDDPLTQAAKWNLPGQNLDLADYGAALDRWTDYYDREGIDQIAFGAVIMRRRSGVNWVRAESMIGGRGSAGALVMRIFHAEDFLCELTDEAALLDVNFVLVPEHRLEQRLASSGGQWQLQEATLSLAEGIGFQGNLDVNTAMLLQTLDGSNTLGQAVRTVGRALELSQDEMAAFSETGIAMAKRLFQLGFLVLAPN
ncbi:MAG TPA: class I SAM-dependent methyltransferase [Candidatus Acidoferrum sp.]|nr:class I SAM-dependent methyltransferase [Candidatus Acidoferrum sp.]